MSQFQADSDWLHWCKNPVQPRFKLPKGAVDAHCHVFGPGEKFPFSPDRKYTPCDASKDQLFALRDYLGFERNVIVQATCHGSNNSALVDALIDSEGKAKGVATIKSTITDDELQALDFAGVRGVRFNFVKRLVDTLPFKELENIAHRIKALGWHIVIYFEAQDLAEYYDFFTSLPVTVVVDHMGRPDVSKSVNGADFDLFIKLLNDNENFWSKVSCPERISKTGPNGYQDVIPFARRVVETFPDRVLWGTDWPHPNMKSHMPDDGHLVNFIPHIASTVELQHKLLVENPLKLYWPELK
jgi:2-pyrone-4,6-dicarboxylate lactonase